MFWWLVCVLWVFSCEYFGGGSITQVSTKLPACYKDLCVRACVVWLYVYVCWVCVVGCMCLVENMTRGIVAHVPIQLGFYFRYILPSTCLHNLTITPFLKLHITCVLFIFDWLQTFFLESTRWCVYTCG